MIRLRGHHLFCATLFQGHGYSEPFTRQMESVLAALKTGEKFTLLTSSDSLCAACPHRLPAGDCALGGEDVLARDNAALAVTHSQPGEILTPAQAGERLRLVTESQWQSVCRGCCWQREGLCSWELFQQFRQHRFV